MHKFDDSTTAPARTEDVGRGFTDVAQWSNLCPHMNATEHRVFTLLMSLCSEPTPYLSLTIAEIAALTPSKATKPGEEPYTASVSTIAHCINALSTLGQVTDENGDAIRVSNKTRGAIRIAPWRSIRHECIASQNIIGATAHRQVNPDPSVNRLQGTITMASLHPAVWGAARAVWENGHHHEAVHNAAKAVNAHLQAKVGRSDISEADLIRQCFSKDAPKPGNPRLRFELVKDPKTRESMRQGASDFGAGCFVGIRNPIGHLPNSAVDLDEQSAMERLAAFSLLARWIDEAEIEAVDLG